MLLARARLLLQSICDLSLLSVDALHTLLLSQPFLIGALLRSLFSLWRYRPLQEVLNNQFIFFEGKAELTAELSVERNRRVSGEMRSTNQKSFKIEALSADELMQFHIIQAILD
jgi:hypothetical protein